MICPACMSSDEVNHLVSHDSDGYSACVICLMCNRQVRVVKESMQDAMKEAREVFEGHADESKKTVQASGLSESCGQRVLRKA